MKKKKLGKYIVSDPKVCHGIPTFIGTRIMVHQVMEQLSAGLAWETIIEEWNGKINNQAIAEAIRLAGKALLVQAS
jgi:uncharacterized protein (DUF433 family)